MRVGDYVQLRRRDAGPPARREGRGTIARIDGDWATVRLPEGGWFQAHLNNLTLLERLPTQEALRV